MMKRATEDLLKARAMIAPVTILCGSCTDRHPTVEAARACAREMFDEWSEYLTLSYAESGGAVPHRVLSSDDQSWDHRFADEWHKNQDERGEPACAWLGSCTGPAVAVVEFQDNGEMCPVCPTHADAAAGLGYPVHPFPIAS